MNSEGPKGVPPMFTKCVLLYTFQRVQKTRESRILNYALTVKSLMIGTRSSLMHYIYIISFVSSISCSANGLHDVTTPCDDLCYISKADRA